MKYNIRVYVDGVLSQRKTSTKNFNWDWLEMVFNELKSKYTKMGYEEIRSSTDGDRCDSVLYNERQMKAVVLSYESEIVLDFYDSEGHPIIEGKTYLGNLAGEKFDGDHNYDRYTIHMGSLDSLYIRNITRMDGHSVSKDGYHYYMSAVTPDRYNFDQEYIDKLGLVATTK